MSSPERSSSSSDTGDHTRPIYHPDACSTTASLARIYHAAMPEYQVRDMHHYRYEQGSLAHALPPKQARIMTKVAQHSMPDRPSSPDADPHHQAAQDTLSPILEHYRYLLPVTMDGMLDHKLQIYQAELLDANKAQIDKALPDINAERTKEGLAPLKGTDDDRALVLRFLLEQGPIKLGAIAQFGDTLLSDEDVYHAHVIAAQEIADEFLARAIRYDATLHPAAYALDESEYSAAQIAADVKASPISADDRAANEMFKARAEAESQRYTETEAMRRLKRDTYFEVANKVSIPGGQTQYQWIVALSDALFESPLGKLCGEGAFQRLSAMATAFNDVGADADDMHRFRRGTNLTALSAGSGLLLLGAYIGKHESPTVGALCGAVGGLIAYFGASSAVEEHAHYHKVSQAVTLSLVDWKQECSKAYYQKMKKHPPKTLDVQHFEVVHELLRSFEAVRDSPIRQTSLLIQHGRLGDGETPAEAYLKTLNDLREILWRLDAAKAKLSQVQKPFDFDPSKAGFKR